MGLSPLPSIGSDTVSKDFLKILLAKEQSENGVN
jgi:hypothetical protein